MLMLMLMLMPAELGRDLLAEATNSKPIAG